MLFDGIIIYKYTRDGKKMGRKQLLDGTIVTEVSKTERPTATESFETTLLKFLKPDDSSTTVVRLEETIENQIKSYIERKEFKLEDLLSQAGVATTEHQSLEDIGGLEILLSIYSARGMDFGIIYFLLFNYLFQPGMTFFISNVKEMGISHVVAMKLYQRFKLWRAQAEIKIVVEDLLLSTATAAADDDTTQIINDNNQAIVTADDSSAFYNGWKNKNNITVPMTVNSDMTISTSSSAASPYAIGLQMEIV